MRLLLKMVSVMALVAANSAAYGATNYVFGDYKNQMSGHIGVSMRSRFEALYTAEIQYSQPTTFFRMAARQNLEFITARGSGNRTKYNQPGILGVSQDAFLFQNPRLYVGAGLGAYIKSRATDRISSKFTFGEKLFLGVKLSDNTAAEVFVRHFSNGRLTDDNTGQNFLGMSLSYNF